VARDSTPPPALLHDGSPSQDIRAVEAELRKQHLLVVCDPTRPWLWSFHATTLDKAAQSPPALPQIPGYRLQRTSAHSYRPSRPH
jgi:hypothetical protein